MLAETALAPGLTTLRSELVRFSIRSAARGTLNMRIPEWVQHAAVLTALAAAAVLVIAVL